MLRRVLQFAALIVFFAVVLSGSLYVLYRMNLVILPGFITNIINPTQPSTEIIPGDGGLIFDALHTRDDMLPEGVMVERDLSEADLTALVARLVPEKPLNLTNVVTLSENGNSVTYTNMIRILPEGFTAQVERDGKPYRSISSDGKTITITEAAGGSMTRLSEGKTQNLYVLCGIPDIGLLTDGLGAKPQNIQVVRSDKEGNVLSADFILKDVGLTDNYIFSRDYGIILSAASKTGDGRTVYILSTTAISLE